MKLGEHKARNLLAGDVIDLGEVVECLGVAPGCCDVFIRDITGGFQVQRYLLDELVEVTGTTHRRSAIDD